MSDRMHSCGAAISAAGALGYYKFKVSMYFGHIGVTGQYTHTHPIPKTTFN